MGAEQREQKSEPSHACERPAVQSQEDQGAAGARRYMYFLSCASRVVFARSSERARAGGGGDQCILRLAIQMLSVVVSQFLSELSNWA